MRRRGKHRAPERVPRLALWAALALGVVTSAQPNASLSLASPAGPTLRSVPPVGAPGSISTSSGRSDSTSAGGGGGAKPAPGWTPPKLPDMGRGWRVIIPSLGVDAPVIDLGLNPDGTLEVPTDYQVTGWYSLGPK